MKFSIGAESKVLANGYVLFAKFEDVSVGIGCIVDRKKNSLSIGGGVIEVLCDGSVVTLWVAVCPQVFGRRSPPPLVGDDGMPGSRFRNNKSSLSVQLYLFFWCTLSKHHGIYPSIPLIYIYTC